MLMHFIYAIAIFMAGSGMKEILAGTFGSIDKMLSGKKIPAKLLCPQDVSGRRVL